MPRPKSDRVGFAVRLPRVLAEQLRAQAAGSGVSVNSAIETAVVEWCGGPDGSIETEGTGTADPVRGRRRSGVPDVRVGAGGQGQRERSVGAGSDGVRAVACRHPSLTVRPYGTWCADPACGARVR